MRCYIHKNRAAVFCFVVITFASAVSSVFLSYLLGMFTDTAMSGEWNNLWLLATGTLVYIFLDTCLQYFMGYTKESAINKIGRDLRADLIQKIESLLYKEKVKQEDSYYLSMLNNDVPTIEQEYFGSLGAICFQIFCFCLAIASAISIQPLMTIIMILISIIPVLFPKLTAKHIQKAKEDEQQAKASYLGMLTQIFQGFSLLKLFHSFQEINREHERENSNLCKKKIRFSQLNSALYAGVFGCGNLVFLGTWVVGLAFVLRGYITLPELIIFSQLMTFVAGPIQIIGERYASFVAASAVFKRILRFLQKAPEEENSWGNSQLEQIQNIQLHNVQVSAGKKILLDNVELALHQGDRVAILGESGSGKSTLIRYLAALVTGTGTYEINGSPTNSYSYQDFRKNIAFMEQNSVVFNGSVRDNLTLFSHFHTDDSTLVQTLSDVGLTKWYGTRGNSLDAPIGTERQRMSGGEERRLNLARILLKNADLVLLDEPTTGLDAESRLFIEKTISGLQCNILMVVMHEYSPEFLSTFNRVINVENGHIYEKSLPEVINHEAVKICESNQGRS